MRTSLSELRPGSTWNFGLVHEHWLLFGSEKVDDTEAKNSWLDLLSSSSVSPDYAHFHRRWADTLERTGAVKKELHAASRILVGHGNPSGTQVGLTVHHTWGVPVIPGSALKGLLSHYLDEQYGPDDPKWRGPTWRDGRVVEPPGEHHAFIFGAPSLHGELEGGRAGGIAFHDALYVPSSSTSPFVRDVLTVHQKGYYDSRGGSAPCDFDDPNPVGFVDVRAGAGFLIALDGPQDWAGLVLELLIEALDEWGVGGKTSLGYGRLLDPEPAASKPAAVEPEPGPEASTKSEVFEGFIAALNGTPMRTAVSDALDEWGGRVGDINHESEKTVLLRLLKKKRKKLQKKEPGLAGRLTEVIDALSVSPE